MKPTDQMTAPVQRGPAMKAKRPRYYITTWNSDTQSFTPHAGVRCGPYSLWGLRKAIRKLREIGYPCDYRGPRGVKGGSGDPSVSIERVDS